MYIPNSSNQQYTPTIQSLEEYHRSLASKKIDDDKHKDDIALERDRVHDTMILRLILPLCILGSILYEFAKLCDTYPRLGNIIDLLGPVLLGLGILCLLISGGFTRNEN